MVTLRARAGSLHRPPSGIHIPSRLSHLRLEAEAREVTVLALESEAESEEEVEDRRRFFRSCRWINRPFTCLGVLAEGAVAAATAASKAEDRCVPGGMVVGREVDISGVYHHRCIDLIQRSVGDAVIWFCMPLHSIGGGGGGEKVSWRKL